MLKELKKVHEKNKWHNEDVYTHSYRVMIETIKLTNDEDLIIAALYHDIGKIESIEGHEEIGAEMFREIAEKNGFKSKEKIAYLIRNHLEINEIIDPENPNIEEDFENFKKKRFWKELLILGYADMLGSQLKENAPEEFKFREEIYVNNL